MAYFPNGTSGMVYMEQYCFRCIHWKDLRDGRGEGCPIMDLHLLWNYDAVGSKKDDTKEMALNLLIPISKDGIANEQCSMFASTGSVAARKAWDTRRIRERLQPKLAMSKQVSGSGPVSP